MLTGGQGGQRPLAGSPRAEPLDEGSQGQTAPDKKNKSLVILKIFSKISFLAKNKIFGNYKLFCRGVPLQPPPGLCPWTPPGLAPDPPALGALFQRKANPFWH